MDKFLSAVRNFEVDLQSGANANKKNMDRSYDASMVLSKRVRSEKDEGSGAEKRQRSEIESLSVDAENEAAVNEEHFKLFQSLKVIMEESDTYYGNHHPRYKPFEGGRNIGVSLNLNFWIENKDRTGQILSNDIRELIISVHSNKVDQSLDFIDDQNLKNMKHVIVLCVTGLDMPDIDESFAEEDKLFMKNLTSVPTRHAINQNLKSYAADLVPLPSILLWRDIPPDKVENLIELPIDEIFLRYTLVFKVLQLGKNFADELMFYYEEDDRKKSSNSKEPPKSKCSGWLIRKRNHQKARWSLKNMNSRWELNISWKGVANEQDTLLLRKNTWPLYENGEVILSFESDYAAAKAAANGKAATIAHRSVMILVGYYKIDESQSAPRDVIDTSDEVVGIVGDECWMKKLFTKENVDTYILSNEEKEMHGYPLSHAVESTSYITTDICENFELASNEEISIELEDGEFVEEYCTSPRLKTESCESCAIDITYVREKDSVDETSEDGSSKSDSIESGFIEEEEEKEKDEEKTVNLKVISAYPQKIDQHHVDGIETKLLAMDCEMVMTKEGLELARISIVDRSGSVVYDHYVKPQNPVMDYLTKFSGITEKHLKSATRDLKGVQKDLLKLIDNNTYIVGHGLENDFHALKLIHSRVIDTAALYPNPKGGQFRMGLRQLCLNLLGKDVQPGTGKSGHDSVMDARAAMELALLKLQYGETFGLPDLWSYQKRPPRESIFDVMSSHSEEPLVFAVISGDEKISCSECPPQAKIWSKFAYGYRREHDAHFVAKLFESQGSIRNGFSIKNIGCNTMDSVKAQSVKCIRRSSSEKRSLTLISYQFSHKSMNFEKSTNPVEEIDNVAESIYKAANANTLLVICCQHSMSRYNELSTLKTRARWSSKTQENDSNDRGETNEPLTNWSEASERELLAEVTHLLNGVTFLGMKRQMCKKSVARNRTEAKRGSLN